MAEPSAELLRRARAGEASALADLVQSQQSYVYSIAMTLMRDPTDAADMTQESFLRALRGLPSYRGETRFTTWLYRLVTNVCLDGLRRHGREPAWVSLEDTGTGDDAGALSPAASLADPDPTGDPERHALQTEELQRVRAALDHLPPAQRLALTLHYFQDLSYDEIADVMRLPLNTVKSHIRRAKVHLLPLLGPDGGTLEVSTCGA